MAEIERASKEAKEWEKIEKEMMDRDKKLVKFLFLFLIFIFYFHRKQKINAFFQYLEKGWKSS